MKKLSPHIQTGMRAIVKRSHIYHDKEGTRWINVRGHGEFILDPDDEKLLRALRTLVPKDSKHHIKEIVRALLESDDGTLKNEEFNRYAYLDGTIFVDLGGNDRTAVEIAPGGFSITYDPPVYFKKPAGLLPLPRPSKEHDDLLSELARVWPHLNRNAVIKIAAFLIVACNSEVCCAILQLLGPAGAAKSTSAKMIRRILDPNVAPLRRAPRNEHELFIAANNSRVLNLENLSNVPPWLADALCSIVTGVAHPVRKLYSDTDEILLTARVPVIMNGISELIVRPDLRDRALTVHLPSIDPRQRRTEKDVWAEFDAALPRILGALYDSVANALVISPTLQHDELPRMADFFEFVAGATYGWAGFTLDEFHAAYHEHDSIGDEIAIDSSPIGRTLMELLDRIGTFSGTMSDLLKRLNGKVDAPDRSRDWPRTPEGLRAAIERIRENLKRQGVVIRTFRSSDRKHARRMELTLMRGTR